MKKLSLILVLFISGLSYAQAQVTATEGVITLTPAKVYIPSTGDYVYLVETSVGKNGEKSFSLFISKDSVLFQRFTSKGNDSLARVQGAVFKPLSHYTKKQWKKLSKEIKMYFPAIAHEELEKMNFYLIFNYAIEKKTTVATTPGSKTPSGGPTFLD